jgi:NADPH2:quinone reductase
MKAIRYSTFGGPEVLVHEDMPRPVPGEGQALVKVEYAGVNFIDTYRRTGAYKVELPSTPGGEGAGTIEALGTNVSNLATGDRVAWAASPGSYAEYAIVDADKLVPVPGDVSTRVAAAVMLQGMTAHYLACSTYPLKAGDRCLIHAAAGGVGLLLVQIAKRCGAFVIGTAGSEEKADLARAAGADEVIVYTREDFVSEVKSITRGEGVHVVYDSVGRSTFLRGFDVLAKRGMMVLFGQSSGAVDPIDPQLLNAKGSLFLTRPTMIHYTLTREELLQRSGDIFDWIASGELDVRIGAEFPLSEAAEAHRALEGRLTTGKVLLRITT